MKKIMVTSLILSAFHFAQASDTLTYHFEVQSGGKAPSVMELPTVLNSVARTSHQVSEAAEFHRPASFEDVSVEPLSVDPNGRVETRVSYHFANSNDRIQVDTVIKIGGGETVTLSDFGARKVVLTLTSPTAKAAVAPPAPREGSIATAGRSPDRTYAIRASKKPRFEPTRVWSDDSFTYLELPAGYGELAIVFALSDEGAVELVNFRWEAESLRLIVPGVREHSKLMLGEKYVVVDRI